jgi:hypothetical protein
MDSAGTLTSTGAAIGTLAPSFHPNLHATVLADDSILLTGKKTSGQTSVPALLKLTANLVLDTTFGSGGILTLPSPGAQTDVALVRTNPDGTATALAPNPASLVRVFADDRPVVTLGRVRSDGQTVRLSVTIRGARPIDTTSLDDDDLRLIHEGGARTKLRLVNFVESGGVVTAQYRVRRDLASQSLNETVTVRTVAGQILDDAADENLSRDIGQIIL